MCGGVAGWRWWLLVGFRQAFVCGCWGAGRGKVTVRSVDVGLA